MSQDENDLGLSPEALLRVRGLQLSVAQRGIQVPILKGIDFDLDVGEMVGLVGPSGAGKSLTALALLGLEPPGSWRSGAVHLRGVGELGTLAVPWGRIRGRELAIVFQDPAAAFDPLIRVGVLFEESARAHGMPIPIARQRGLELLERMALPDPSRLWRSFSQELSGGQRQRVLLSLALLHSPRILIADEPTTALDVTVQAQILELLRDLSAAQGLSILLVTHDLALVAENCQRMILIDGGKTVEEGDVAMVFSRPKEAVTRRLIQAAGGGS